MNPLPHTEASSDLPQGRLSAGQMLRAAREAQGLHLAMLSVNLKVSVRQLEALEADQYEAFKGATFVRALAQSVCRQLKIDPAPVLAALPQAEATQAGRVREDLQTWVSVRPGDAGAWQALARVSERLGQPLASLRAQAEAQAALGDLAGAVDRLRAGQRLSRSSGAVESMEGVVIESRLKALEQQRRAELERERRGEDD